MRKVLLGLALLLSSTLYLATVPEVSAKTVATMDAGSRQVVLTDEDSPQCDAGTHVFRTTYPRLSVLDPSKQGCWSLINNTILLFVKDPTNQKPLVLMLPVWMFDTPKPEYQV